MDIATAFQGLQQQLQALYEPSESANIADWVLEAISGKRRRDWVLQRSLPLNDVQQQQLAQYTGELLQHRPVQYVLAESWFYDMKLYVDERVLIPRPETEELAQWLLQYLKTKPGTPVVLDIGTGSGCLALAVKKHCPAASVYALDLSEGALDVAGRNAATLGLDITLEQRDVLDPAGLQGLPLPDVIISNPPYITEAEQQEMLPHVLGFEPHTALFVTNQDPLQFYKAIETYAASSLQPGGAVFLELNRDFALQTKQYYENQGWQTVLKTDMQGEYRMLYCFRPSADNVAS